MKISIIVTDDNGKTFRGEVELVPSAPEKVAKRKIISKLDQERKSPSPDQFARSLKNTRAD